MGGSDIAAAAFVRAISRFYASFTGRLGPANIKKVPDAIDQHAKLLAANIDSRFKAAVKTMASIAPLYMVRCSSCTFMLACDSDTCV